MPLYSSAATIFITISYDEINFLLVNVCQIGKYGCLFLTYLHTHARDTERIIHHTRIPYGLASVRTATQQ